MQLGTIADQHTVSWMTNNMLIDIQFVDQHTLHVCRSRYCVSIGIHALMYMYLDRRTVCQLTYSMSIDIHAVYMYVDRHTVCRSTHYMSIEILYVDRQFPTGMWLGNSDTVQASTAEVQQ